MPKRVIEKSPKDFVKPDADTAEARWNQIASLYLNPKYSDMTIQCGNETFAAHRSIVCPQSEYFRRCCDENFQQDSKSLDLTGHAPALIKGMLEFLYTGDYTVDQCEVVLNTDEMSDSGQSTETDEQPSSDRMFGTSDPEVDTRKYPETTLGNHPACLHAQMHAKGLWFLIPGLQAKAKKNFRASFMGQLDTELFPAIITEVYSTQASARELKDVMVELTMDNLSILWNQGHGVLNKDVLEGAPDFMLDLCIANVKKNVEQPTQIDDEWGYGLFE